jgi:hypothetical protein
MFIIKNYLTNDGFGFKIKMLVLCKRNKLNKDGRYPHPLIIATNQIISGPLSS